MTTIRKIVTSKIEGDSANNTDTNEIRPFGETAFYIDNNKLTLMMFDGVRTHRDSKVLSPGVLWGSDADAGDGSGADTIKLIPDSELFANGSDQYIIVDPTGGEPGHIHLRAGGTQDSSSADLYLGGELTCVRVSDTSNNVTIRTTNVGDPNITMNWEFQTDGNLYFPGIGNNRIGESEPGLVVSSDNSVVLQSNNNGESKEWLFNTNGSITFPDSTIQTTAYTGGADTLDSVTDRGATTTNNITVGAVITTDLTGKTAPAVGAQVTGIRPPEGAGSNNGYVWVPDETQISSLGDITGWTLTNSDGIFSTTVVQMRNDLGAAWAIETADPLIYTGTYTFTSPNYAPATPLPLDINVGANTWTFGTNGSVTFPDNTVQTSAYNVGETLIELDGVTTAFSPASVKTLIFVTTAVGYSGSDAFTITLPTGIPGQRLVVISVSSLCTGTINGDFTLNPASTLELIFTSVDGWVTI